MSTMSLARTIRSSRTSLFTSVFIVLSPRRCSAAIVGAPGNRLWFLSSIASVMSFPSWGYLAKATNDKVITRRDGMSLQRDAVNSLL